MKQYIKPQLEIHKFPNRSIVTASGSINSMAWGSRTRENGSEDNDWVDND